MKTLIETYKKRITLILLITIIINIIAITFFDTPLKNDVCKNGIVSFELARDLDESVNILDSWDTDAKINAGLSLGFDFLFLLIYSSFIALLIFNINNRLWKGESFYKFGNILIGLIFIAAFLDIIENIALIKLLLGDLKQIWSSVAYYFAVIKFVIIIISIIYLLISWGILLFEKKYSKCFFYFK